MFYKKKHKLNDNIDKINESLFFLMIPYDVIVTAKKIYETSMQKKITIGNSSKNFTRCCFMIACYIHEFPILVNDLEFDRFSLYSNSIKKIKETVLPELNLEIKKVSVEKYIERYCLQLEYNKIHEKNIKFLFKKMSNKFQVILQWRNYLVAAAVIYIYAKNHMLSITQERLCFITHTLPVTLRKTIKNVKNLYKREHNE